MHLFLVSLFSLLSLLATKATPFPFPILPMEVATFPSSLLLIVVSPFSPSKPDFAQVSHKQTELLDLDISSYLTFPKLGSCSCFPPPLCPQIDNWTALTLTQTYNEKQILLYTFVHNFIILLLSIDNTLHTHAICLHYYMGWLSQNTHR